jgi:hypothetical protein
VATSAELRKSFEVRACRRPFAALPVIEDEGLTLGHGTVLMRMGCTRQGEQKLMLDADEARFLALLAAVYGRQIAPRVMHHVRRASDQWSRGDRALAHIELAFARFPRLETRDDAFRLYLAEDLLETSMTPQSLTGALGFDPNLLKYDPNQPRQPAGSGRRSGEWVKSQDTEGADVSSASAAKDPTADNVSSARTTSGIAVAERGFLGEEVAPAAIDALAALALRLSGPTIIGGALLIPTPNSGGIEEGEVPALPGVHYRLDGQAGTLSITAAVDGKDLTIGAQLAPGGLYVDEQGQALGRFLVTGIYLDADTVVSALHDELGSDSKDQPSVATELTVHPDEPKLCPDPSPDRPGAGNTIFAIAYAEYVNEEIVNPDFPPLPPGLAFALFNPKSGQDVVFDGCQYTTGDMQEYKGHYADLMAKSFFWDGGPLEQDFLDQANRQVQANTAANIRNGRITTDEWHFDERQTADYAWRLFKGDDLLGRGKIRIYYTPYWEHINELYSDSEN